MLPDNFEEYGYLEGSIMSNLDGNIDSVIADHIKGKQLFSRYSGWNFNGLVYWFNDTWNCDIYTYGSFCQTFSSDDLKEIMNDVSNEYGYD